ncbi:MAG: hypothetical protein IKO62_07120 [Bacteroidales bacterium]|nr:hypothetical protein [Bacteroidales bacterium]
MSDKLKYWWKKVCVLMREIFHWFYPYHIFEEEPMEFRFVNIRRPKVRYDIKRHFLSFSIKSKDDGFKYAFFILILTLLFVMPYFSRNVGVSTREWQQNEYSEAVYKYYQDGDDTYTTMPQYVTKGQLSDILLVSAAHSLGFKNIFRLKHRLSALLGWLLIVVSGFFLAKNVSWRSAFFCSLLMFCTPRLLGYTFGNFNDTLFALAFFFTLFQIWQFCYDFPLIRWIRVVGIFLGILVATTTSLSGFALCELFFFFVIIYYVVKNPMKKFFTGQYWVSLLTLIMIVGATSLLVVLMNLILSPGFQIQDLRGGDKFMQMFVATSQQLPQFFEGKTISIEQPPTDYVMKYVFITTPFVVILGLLLCVVFFRTILKEFSLFTIFALTFTILYLLWSFSSKYMGSDIVCTVIFMMLPLLVMMAALGYEAVLRKVDDRYTNAVIVVLAFFLSALPLRHVIFNRPLTLCYFNEVSGGIHNAAERYELDINDQSSKVAEQWFSQYLAGIQDSLDLEKGRQMDSLLLCMDSMVSDMQGVDSLMLAIKTDSVSVYTNGNQAFCQMLSGENLRLSVVHADVHSMDELEGDYYVLFGNRTGLFKQIDSAFHTIDLERVPVVSFFKKNKNPGNKNEEITSLEEKKE